VRSAERQLNWSTVVVDPDRAGQRRWFGVPVDEPLGMGGVGNGEDVGAGGSDGVSLLPVASWSGSTESFPSTSITVRALASRAFSRSVGSLGARPADLPSALVTLLAPGADQQGVKVYRPSRRSNAHLPARSGNSYSAKIRAL